MQQQFPGWSAPQPAMPPVTPGPPPGGPGPAPRRRGRRLLIVGLVAVVLGIGVVVVVLAITGASRPPVLDGRAVEGGVAQILAEYGTATPESITCPDGQEVRPGATFECTARTKLGMAKPIRIEVTSNAGDYLVGKPG